MTNTNTALENAKKNTESLVGNKEKSLRNVACLMTLPDISIPTGKKTVKKKELILHDGTSVTSTKLSGGALEWFPQESLSDFGTLRKQAYKVFEEKTVCVGGMHLVALNEIDSLILDMKRIEIDWDQAVLKMEEQFDGLLQGYAVANPDIETIIKDYSLPKGEFMSVFKFKVLPPLAVQPLFPEQEAEIAISATESLWEEISSEAKRQYKTSFAKGENVTQKAKTALSRIRDKLVSMSFLDDGIDIVVETFDSVMSRLPKTGKIEGGLFHELAHFVSQLGDEDRLKATAAGNTDDGLNISAFYKPLSQTVDLEQAVFEQADTTPFINQLTEDFDDIQISDFDIPVAIPQQSAQSEMEWQDY
ncbi:MAG: hypothetical protein ACI9JN_000997 [Bacteroidia bacterium]|jgi:hypothetical protein